MLWSCDVVSAWEDGGIGGIIAIVVGALGLWLNDWVQKQGAQPPSK